MSRKLIDKQDLLDLIREDRENAAEDPADVYLWVKNLVNRCPPAKKVCNIPYEFGTDVWTVEGYHGKIIKFNIGQSGSVRVIAQLDFNGQRIGCSLKKIGEELLLENPKEKRDAP